ncbi:unnamed protein product [Leuciscus chuanchicus]
MLVACNITHVHTVAKLNDERASGVQSVQGGSHCAQYSEIKILLHVPCIQEPPEQLDRKPDQALENGAPATDEPLNSPHDSTLRKCYKYAPISHQFACTPGWGSGVPVSGLHLEIPLSPFSWASAIAASVRATRSGLEDGAE